MIRVSKPNKEQKMKKIKTLTMCALAICAISGIVSCGQTTNVDDGSEDYKDPTYNPFGKYDEPVRVNGVMEYLAHNDSRVPTSITPDNQVFIKKIKEEMNIDWKYLWKAPSTQYENKLTSTMLSKKYPDILKVNASQYEEFYKRGLLKDLTETYKYASPKTKAYLNRDPDVVNSLKTEDGKIYAIPQYDDINREMPVMYYRRDWLKTNGDKVPTTPDELKTLLTSFKNNQNATAGLALSKSFYGSYFTMDRYLQMFGAKPYSWVKDSSGNLVASENTNEAKAALTYMRDLYENQLISKDFAATDASSVEANIKTGKTGVVFGPWWQYEYPIGDLLNDQDWAVAQIPLEEGATIVLPKQQISYYYVALKGFKNPEVLMKLINAYIEYDGQDGCAAEDGYVWSWCPTQFYDPYEVDTQYKEFQKQILIDPTASGEAPSTWSNHLKNLWSVYDEYKIWKDDHGAVKYQSNWFSNIIGRLESDGAWATILKTRETGRVKFNEYTALPTASQKDYGSQTATHSEEYYVKAIMGEKNITTDWDKYISEWDKLGGSKITEEVNTWYKKQD